MCLQGNTRFPIKKKSSEAFQIRFGVILAANNFASFKTTVTDSINDSETVWIILFINLPRITELLLSLSHLLSHLFNIKF